MPQETRRLTHIQVGTRYRLHLGDIAALAESMQALGLLHPVVITPDNRLIAGARRLAAAKRLGWEEIAVHVVDVPSMLETEYDENVMRADFTLVEKVRLGMAIEHEIAARNAAKMREAGQQGGRGKKKENPMTKNHRVSEEKAPPLTTRAQIGRVIGLGGTAYSQAKVVLQAAEHDPEKYGWIAEILELKGNVSRAYHTLKAEENKHTTSGPEPPPPEPPPPRIADRLSKDVLDICQIMDVLNDLLKARNEAFMIQLVQLSQVDLETVGGLFTMTHALTGVWLDEIIAAIKGETDDQT